MIDFGKDARRRLMNRREARDHLLETALGRFFLQDFTEAQYLAEGIAQIVTRSTQATGPGLAGGCRRFIGV